MRFRLSKRKSWRRAEIAELRLLVETMTNRELCERYQVDVPTLQHAFSRYKIKRSEEAILRMKSNKEEKNPNWKGGISKDGARYSRIQREKYPERKHARDAVYRALKNGTLTKPLLCKRCGSHRYLEGHHKSYEEDKWLEVEWLCKKCHNVADKELEYDSNTINSNT